MNILSIEQNPALVSVIRISHRIFILFEYPAACCGDGHENRLNL